LTPRPAAIHRDQSQEAGVALPPGTQSRTALTVLCQTKDACLAGIARIPHAPEADVVVTVVRFVPVTVRRARAPRGLLFHEPPRSVSGLVPISEVSQKTFALRGLFFSSMLRPSIHMKLWKREKEKE